ncbi:shikimate kinase [Cladorrhinum sp. PSN259]|nr:shikimate kinase [Cladorrhinum sp. PSN259]
MGDPLVPSNVPIPHHLHRWIWFITGPTACGKTTIAKSLASRLGFTFVEGDDYHPAASVEKMASGHPLTDQDREGWLKALKEHETCQPGEGESRHLVMTCSALKKHYRDVLRQGGKEAGDLRIRFVLLDAPEEVLMERARNRKGHFAKENLVKSQVAILERPVAGVEDDVLVVDVNRNVEDVERETEIRVREVMGQDDNAFLPLQ